MANINFTQIFGNHSGSSLLESAKNIATQALDKNPLKNDDGTIAKNEEGETFVDVEKARHSINKQAGQLQGHIMRDMSGPLSDSSVKDIREQINNLRKLEVASVCVDIITADSKNNPGFLRTKLNNAMQGLHPANEKQNATSSVLNATLNSKLSPEDSPKDRVTIKVDHKSL